MQTRQVLMSSEDCKECFVNCNAVAIRNNCAPEPVIGFELKGSDILMKITEILEHLYANLENACVISVLSHLF